MVKSRKKKLLNWSIGFCLGNAFFYWMISLRYFTNIPWFDTEFLLPKGKLLIESFLTLASLGQMGLLSLITWLLLWVCLIFLPRPRLIIPLGIVLATTLAMFLIIDSSVYQLYRFHLNGIILQFLLNGLGGEMLGISSREMAYAMGLSLGIFFLESLWAWFLWRRISQRSLLHGGIKWILASLGISLYLSYGLLIYSAGFPISRFLCDASSLIPSYTPVLGTLLPGKNASLQMENLWEGFLLQPRKMNAPLNYPTQTLRFEAQSTPKNLIIIVIDTWRFDTLTREIMPNLYKFAKKSLVFSNHYSGGNCTGPGIFTLFYGLPSTYWTAMETQEIRPLLIEEFLKRHYQLAVFSSTGLKSPEFHKTVFNKINSIQIDMMPGKDSFERDQLVTQHFAQFINHHDQQPFFTFLFYDEAHSYCSFNNPFHTFAPIMENCGRYNLTNTIDPLGYSNRYKNALYSIDNEINKVLDVLKSKGLMKNTVIVITGDHGEEFNDNHTNYWGHASNYTRYQVQTPLLIYWPDQKPQIFTHQTSHFDVAPTLMKKMLGCLNNPSDYSLGSDLFDPTPRPYLIIGSYCAFGILQPQQIIDISPSGTFRVEGLNGKPLQECHLNFPVMRQAFIDLKKFYKEWGIRGQA